MRSSLRYLLLIFLAWCIAYFVAPIATLTQTRTTWRHQSAAYDIRQIRYFAESSLHANPGLTIAQFDFNTLWRELGRNVDPWGEPYRVVELNVIDESPDGLKSTIHAYSLGSDGLTRTDGNDLDDINSWNYDWNRFYGPQIALDARRTNLLRTLWITPIAYLVLMIALSAICHKPIRDRATPE